MLLSAVCIEILIKSQNLQSFSKLLFFVDFLLDFLWFNLHILFYAYEVRNDRSKSLSKRGCHNTVVVNYDARAFYLHRTKSHEL